MNPFTTQGPFALSELRSITIVQLLNLTPLRKQTLKPK